MKNTALAIRDGELLEDLIARYGKIVTVSQIEELANTTWDYQQTHNRIQQLIHQGWLTRIKRGLYVISDLSSRGYISVSPYVIANLLVSDSYVSFEAALAFHGLFDQYVNQITSVSLRQYKRTQLDTVQYQFVKTDQKMYAGWEETNIEGQHAKIARAEKSLVDMIHFRQGSYVIDLVIEKLTDEQTDLDHTRIIEFCLLASQKTIKVFGLIFDLLGWDTTALNQGITNRRSTHRMRAENLAFNAKWRLYYDQYFDKYKETKGA